MKTTSKMKATGSRTKNAADVRLRPAARTPGSGLNVQLTVAERDDIDAAKTRKFNVPRSLLVTLCVLRRSSCLIDCGRCRL